jgi:hypothetical protein
MPSSCDDSLKPYVDLGRCRDWQLGESLGSSSTWTAQTFSRLGVAWSWEGRSIVKLPYSSVDEDAELAAACLEPADSHITATFAPGSEKEIQDVNIWTVMMQQLIVRRWWHIIKRLLRSLLMIRADGTRTSDGCLWTKQSALPLCAPSRTAMVLARSVGLD